MILTPRERRDRSRSRAWFLQVHYRWESEGGEGDFLDALRETCARRRVAPARIPYLRHLATTFAANRARVEEAIAASLDNWRMDRLSVIDRGILRLGVTEILCIEELPGKVAIQESVRLAEQYGGSESPRFVNGVLDAVFHDAQAGVH